MKNQRGFALVITLIIAALLVALAVEFVDEVYVDTSISHNFVASQQASILAASGVDGGVRLLQYTLSLQSYTSLLDPWAQPLVFEEAQGKLVVTIEEESGKLNLNYLILPLGNANQPNYDIAARLIKKQGLSPELQDSLSDWLDANEEPNTAGAESNYYSRLKPAYQAKGRALDTLEELRLVKGFDSAVVNKLRRFVTVYADEDPSLVAKININTAPKEVLAALSEHMTDDLVARVIDRRKTTPFKLAAELAQVPGFETIAAELSLSTSAKGAVYRIRSEAFVKETSRVVEAVVRITGMTSTVLYWREY